MKQNKKLIHFPWESVQPSPGQKGPITCNGYLRRQRPSFRRSPHVLLPLLYTLTMVSCGLECPLAQLGTCPGHVSFQPPTHPQLPHQCGHRKSRKVLGSVQALLGNKKKNLNIINLEFSTNPKHCPVAASVKKVDYTPDKTSTTYMMGCAPSDKQPNFKILTSSHNFFLILLFSLTTTSDAAIPRNSK